MQPEIDLLDPFGESADPRRYVPLATSERILAGLAAKIRDGCSPILLSGPSGMGKTLLLHVLGERERLRHGQRVVYSPFLHLAPEECARWLLHLLGISGPAASSPEAVLLGALRSPGGRPTLLMVDEIQAAPEPSVRKLAELAQAGRPALAVVVAGSEGRHLRKLLPVLGPEATLRFPPALPPDEIDALCRATLTLPELSPRLRKALAPERGVIVRAASGIPRLLKAELEVRAQNLVLGGRRRRPLIEELSLDTWTPPAQAPAPAQAPVPAQAAAAAPSPLPPPSGSREPRAEAARRAPRRPAAREAAAAWAARAARDVRRVRERGAESARRSGHAALARTGRAAARARAASMQGAIALARGARIALPAAGLCALALLLPSDHGRAPRIAPVLIAARAPLAALPPAEEAVLHIPVSQPATPPPFQVQAQFNARPWARIRIDGADVGPTPFSRALAPGVYRIEAEFPDGRSLERRVAIGPEHRFVALP
jgi:hypothetical protein